VSREGALAREDVRPKAFVHFVLNTSRFPEQKDFYLRFLNAWVVWECDLIGFLTYDDEHHRLAIVNIADLPDQKPGTSGIDHVAFSLSSLGDLLANYLRLKKSGIEPYWCINHGPTTSLYYRDVDGNQVEMQVDNYDTAEALTASFHSANFAANPIGVQFDPDRLVELYREGRPEAELKMQGVAPRAPGTEYLIPTRWGQGMTEGDIRQEIATLEEKRCKALTSGDVKALEPLLAEDLVHIHGTGHCDRKSTYLDGVAHKFKWHRIQRGALDMRIHGDMVIVTGPLSQEISVNGIEKINKIECFVTQTWVGTDDGWKQSTCHMAFVSFNGQSLL